ncbi:hypothetical protein LOTGIDRAFT_170184 [Lottia gigantea]|uniref:Uncharacterized protein n=1 Tax=Lottia gigantea TaxID=225164 RepID=V3ZIU9_LOTGI|nr:hypothetical protein LOTGIDRAFT_170184 [Lottia gigantea]ESO82265.1 hypothetical protein LOTGIDRAFT_170184 [Lottia gigantea]
MVNTILFIIDVLMIWAAVPSTHADIKTCRKSYPPGTTVPNDELMKALYLADPNFETGYLYTIDFEQKVKARLVHSTLSYNSWLAREHDALKEMTNLWSYFNHIVLSDLHELYAHYTFIKVGAHKPRGIVNFDTISDLFREACSTWDTVKETWPYSCLESNFFCHMQAAIDQMKQIVVETYWKNWDQTIFQKISSLGVDSPWRSNVIDTLFNPVILKFIPEREQENVFYHSKLVWHYLPLINEKSFFRRWFTWANIGFQAVEDQVTRKCSQKSGQPVAVKYYCKAKDFAAKLRTCSGLTDPTPCMYYSAVQDYFVRGGFGEYVELRVINDTIDITRTVLAEFKDRVVANDRNGLNWLYNKYNPYITVDDSMCHTDWPKAFDCTNNIGCDESMFDCNGGYTCRINMMYRFDCVLKFVLKQTKQLVDASSQGNWGSSGVVKAKNDLMLWLSYLPMTRFTSLTDNEINSVIITTQAKVKEYVTSYDTQGLKTFVSNLPSMSFVPQWAKDAACQQVSIPKEYAVFCHLEPLLNSIFLFINAFENSKTSTTKILNPSADYGTVLGQLQLQRVGSLINLQTQEISNQFRDEVQHNFQELSGYFSSLAAYDKTKAEADIAYITGQLRTFKDKISSVSRKVAKSYQVVLCVAIGINVVELVQKTVEVGIAMAQVANPLSTILGGSSILDLADKLNGLAQAAKWETVAETLCEAAFSAETGTAALGEIGLASTGDCVNIGNQIEELITYYEELYENQFDFMDSMSDAARAYLAYQKASDLKSAYTNKNKLTQEFLKHTAVNAYTISTLNVWEIVTEYCVVLTYTRGGEVPDKCETALRSPSHHAVAQVMGYRPDPLCHTNNEITAYRDIPTTPTGANDQAYIDLNALYARETVSFKIPNFQWLKNNGWFGQYDPEKAVYIKRFEIFLPPMSGQNNHLIEVEAQPGMANYLRYGGTKYLLPVSRYTARYTENAYNCYSTKITNPYALCKDDDLVQLCITSNGFVDRKIQPSIYNEWKITVNSLPAGQTAPQPKTNFKIQAGITMCVVNLSSSAKKREIPTLSSILTRRELNRTRRAEHHCCASNQYWTGSQCSSCPSGSRQKLHGVYCQ